jgi:hypothetical protein
MNLQIEELLGNASRLMSKSKQTQRHIIIELLKINMKNLESCMRKVIHHMKGKEAVTRFRARELGDNRQWEHRTHTHVQIHTQTYAHTHMI